jgi:hypothetical protein
MNQFDTLYQKAISDPVFLQYLASDTDDALQSIGIDPTPEIVSAVQTALSSIVTLHDELVPPSTTAIPVPFVS